MLIIMMIILRIVVRIIIIVVVIIVRDPVQAPTVPHMLPWSSLEPHTMQHPEPWAPETQNFETLCTLRETGRRITKPPPDSKRSLPEEAEAGSRTSSVGEPRSVFAGNFGSPAYLPERSRRRLSEHL